MLFAVLGCGVVMTRSRHLPFLQLGQGLGTHWAKCFLVVISYHLISSVTISLEVKNHINNTLAQQKVGRGRLIEVAVE